MSAASTLLQVHALKAGEPPNLPRFRRLVQLRGQLGGITAACYLLYRPVDGQQASVWGFVAQVMPRLLLQLSRTTEVERVELDAGVRGRIDWPGTVKARYAANGGPHIFVCRQRRREFDRAENRLVKFMLQQVEACLNRVPPDLLGWYAWIPGREGGPRLVVPLVSEIAEMAQRVHVLRGSVYLRDVPAPPAIGSQHLLAARTSKNELYGQVADLYELYWSVVEANSWRTWAEIVGQTALLPPDMDEATRQLIAGG